MSLNTIYAIANPLKAINVATNGNIHADDGTYSTLLTVNSSQTLKIEDGSFIMDYAETGGSHGLRVYLVLFIGSLRVPLWQASVAASGTGQKILKFKDVFTAPITLKTGDTIGINFYYTALAGQTIGTAAGTFVSNLIINDYQA